MNYSSLPNPHVNRDNTEIAVSDNDTTSALNKIIKELKKMNIYNAMGHDEEITNEDVS